MMNKFLPAGRLRIALSILGVFLVLGFAWVVIDQRTMAGSQGETGTLEKMIVAGGNAAMDVDLNKLNGNKTRARNARINFELETNAFFKTLVFNEEFRGALPSSVKITTQESTNFPAKLHDSIGHLVLESLEWGGQYEFVIRDSNTGFIFFNVEGQEYEYDPNVRLLNIKGGRMLISDEFAAEMKRPSDAGAIVGTINIAATLRPIEVTTVINGETEANVLPAGAGTETNAGSVPGPDVVVGDLTGLARFGSSA